MINNVTDNCCSLCKKKQSDLKCLIEINLEVFCRYNNADTTMENMNGLWKRTSEFFCEDCFGKFVDNLEVFHKNNSVITSSVGN